MGRPRERTRHVVSGNYKRFFGVWEVGTLYINVYSGGQIRPVVVAHEKGETYNKLQVVHVINTTGDLGEDGMPKDGRTPEQYVKDEVKSFAQAVGDDYLTEIDDGYLN